MNISELCIRRPVMVVLLSISLILVGMLAYRAIPVAALPSYNTPVINVNANLSGASPETMASSVALPLEKQFSTIAGINLITSSSTQGSTSLTLEFDPAIDINAAAVDVQAALLGAQRQLPTEMTDLPSYRKVNPADAPVLFMTMNSPSMSLSDLNDYAENLIAPEPVDPAGRGAGDGQRPEALCRAGARASRHDERPQPVDGRTGRRPASRPTPIRRSASSTAPARP